MPVHRRYAGERRGREIRRPGLCAFRELGSARGRASRPRHRLGITRMGWLRNGAAMAILAHSLIGVSLVWDKVLLRNPQTKNLPAYIFWLGAISIFGLALLP